MSTPSDVPLPARLDVASLSWTSVGAVSAAAGRLAGAKGVEAQQDPQRVAVAYGSERYFRIDGIQPTAFAPLSGFFRTRDGWVRTHANYPHHAAVLSDVLHLEPDAAKSDAERAFLRWDAAAVSEAITRRGGLCVEVRSEDRVADEVLQSAPLVRMTRIAPARRQALPGGPPHAPLRGIRVLDLTRVIAGPVGTRSLAFLGASVLRIDPLRLAEIGWLHLDTGQGKRSAQLDLTRSPDRSRFDELLARTDVIALGYRPASLDRLGLSPALLAERRPGIVVVRHSAWTDPERRGFDSLVQAESGIAVAEGSADAPGVLPAQALDHSAGYLLAAGAIDALERRADEGGSWLVETTLRRIAAELLSLPRTRDPQPAASVRDPALHVQHFDVDRHTVTTTAPAIAYPGGPEQFAPPRPWAGDLAEWWD